MSEPRLVPDCVIKLHTYFCGCDNPEMAWKWVHDYLLTKLAEPHLRSWYFATGSDLIAGYLLDHLGYTEHGGSIGGAWITDLGKELVKFLSDEGCDWFEKGDWVNREGTYLSIAGIMSELDSALEEILP